MAVLITTVDEQGEETVQAKSETLTDSWRKAWQVWDKLALPMTDYTGVREGPEIIVRYARQGE